LLIPTNERDVEGAWLYFETRREAEGAAATAFAKLPEHRRCELLVAPPA
jgi:hypothetical protein